MTEQRYSLTAQGGRLHDQKTERSNKPRSEEGRYDALRVEVDTRMLLLVLILCPFDQFIDRLVRRQPLSAPAKKIGHGFVHIPN